MKYTVPVMFRLNDEKKEEFKPVPKIDESIVVVGYDPPRTRRDPFASSRID